MVLAAVFNELDHLRNSYSGARSQEMIAIRAMRAAEKFYQCARAEIGYSMEPISAILDHKLCFLQADFLFGEVLRYSFPANGSSEDRIKFIKASNHKHLDFVTAYLLRGGLEEEYSLTALIKSVRCGHGYRLQDTQFSNIDDRLALYFELNCCQQENLEKMDNAGSHKRQYELASISVACVNSLLAILANIEELEQLCSKYNPSVLDDTTDISEFLATCPALTAMEPAIDPTLFRQQHPQISTRFSFYHGPEWVRQNNHFVYMSSNEGPQLKQITSARARRRQNLHIMMYKGPQKRPRRSRKSVKSGQLEQ